MSIADLRPLRDQAERRREQKAWNWYYVLSSAVTHVTPETHLF